MAARLQPDTGSKIETIAKKYFPCTCGEIYLSRRLTAPDCPYHANDWESFADEIKALESPAPVQDGWISVESKTPIAYKTGNWDGMKSDPVFTKNDKTGEYHVGVMYEGYLDGNHFKDWYDLNDYEIDTPTHYMEIPD